MFTRDGVIRLISSRVATCPLPVSLINAALFHDHAWVGLQLSHTLDELKNVLCDVYLQSCCLICLLVFMVLFVLWISPKRLWGPQRTAGFLQRINWSVEAIFFRFLIVKPFKKSCFPLYFTKMYWIEYYVLKVKKNFFSICGNSYAIKHTQCHVLFISLNALQSVCSSRDCPCVISTFSLIWFR